LIHIFDTSSFRVLEHYYPGRFPSLWKLLDEAAEAGGLVSVREVYKELEFLAREDWFRTWVREHRKIFLPPTAEEAEFLRQIFAVKHFQTLVGEKQRLKGQPVADPFVIAAARVRQACVVTEEAMKPNAAKIPNVCQHFGVRCTDVEGFMTECGWQF